MSSSACHAGESGGGSTVKDCGGETSSACAEMGKVTAEHKRLEPFAGTFRAEVKMWMGPGSEPMVSTGTMTGSMDLGGRFLHQSYKGDPNDGPFPNFEGRGYWGYNPTSKKYEGVWIDTASCMIQTETGTVDASGKVWTMVGDIPSPQGGGCEKKSVITLVDKDHHKMEMYLDMPGRNRQKGMEINYTRKK